MRELRQYVTAFLSIAVLIAAARADEIRITVDKLPKPVVDAVKAKFPDAKLTGTEKETKGDKVYFEVEFTTKGKSAEMLLTPEGKIVSIEKEIEAKDLPKAVSAAVDARFPKATVRKVEEETKDKAVSYQVVLETAKKRPAAIALDSSGKVFATQEEIKVKDLPKAVVDGLESEVSEVDREQGRRKQAGRQGRLPCASDGCGQEGVPSAGRCKRQGLEGG